jgi:8-amino-7-oxononanoate synthase
MTKLEQTAKKVEQEINLDDRMSLFHQGGKDVFEKVNSFKEAKMLRDFNIYPYYQTIDRNEGPTAIIEGKEVIMLGSNNYLGLTIHPEVRSAAMEAIDQYGTSLTGSRLLNGTHKLHEKLEADLADFFDKESSLVFTTGYQANLGVLSALITEGTYLVIDKTNHASIHDAARLAKGEVVTFNHNDPEDLDRVMSKLDPEVGKLVLVDGVYSMEGDLVRLPEMVKIAKKYQARIAVDDAHGVGLIGPGGRGTVHHYGLENEVDLIIGTFSKSLASVGGFVVGNEKVIDFIRHFGRSILFSASLPPASVAAAGKALEILKREPERVERVKNNGNYLRDKLADMGVDTGDSETAIVPIVIGNELLTLSLWREILSNGVYVNAVLYPAVARNNSLLRTSTTSEHTKDQLDQALGVFKEMKDKHKW